MSRILTVTSRLTANVELLQTLADEAPILRTAVGARRCELSPPGGRDLRASVRGEAAVCRLQRRAFRPCIGADDPLAAIVDLRRGNCVMIKEKNGELHSRPVAACDRDARGGSGNRAGRDGSTQQANPMSCPAAADYKASVRGAPASLRTPGAERFLPPAPHRAPDGASPVPWSRNEHAICCPGGPWPAFLSPSQRTTRRATDHGLPSGPRWRNGRRAPPQDGCGRSSTD
jgi:hypothetical protein